MNEELSMTLAQTYVWHNGMQYFVSTINRYSSAVLAYGDCYAETMAWTLKGSALDRIFAQEESAAGSLCGHLKLVAAIAAGEVKP